jgi:hypothetical protein
MISDTQPITVVPAENLVPVSDHLRRLAPIPPSRMFLINKRLAVYRQKYPEGETFDTSQGDGGASLPAPLRGASPRCHSARASGISLRTVRA